MLKKNDLTHDRLLTLIGQQLLYRGNDCKVVDLLENSQLVLQVMDAKSNIQSNQYGDGHRSVPVTYTVWLFNSEGGLNPELELTELPSLLTKR